ncbi:MAG: hypothetical protein JO280_00480 [Mycobacteriaceae bacterium]|nr:hypothetical protein [Mycobacteriaceae bacterium]
MRQFTRFGACAAAMSMATSVALCAGSGAAVADGTNVASDNSRLVPLSSILRKCDWQNTPWVPSATSGTGFALIGAAGGTVTADVHMTGVIPDIWYGVRLVQVPRPGIGCGAGAPGVGFAQLYTDDAGNGAVTVSAPVMAGATGAWVSVEGPLGNSTQMAGDFRTSDFLAPI